VNRSSLGDEPCSDHELKLHNYKSRQIRMRSQSDKVTNPSEEDERGGERDEEAR
jgi:hypothetical protein